jgi:hypothetical protein
MNYNELKIIVYVPKNNSHYLKIIISLNYIHTIVSKIYDNVYYFQRIVIDLWYVILIFFIFNILEF